MGVAITSSVLASLQPQNPFYGNGLQKWESHTPGTTTPAVNFSDPTLPSRFIACVKREETAKRLINTFNAIQGGMTVEVWADKNLQAVQEATVILLWYVHLNFRS